jgi:hypothetical protein
MVKYSSPHEPEDNKTYSEEVAAMQAIDNPQQDAEPVNAEDASFKKRYGDVRRHMTTVTAQKDKEIVALKAQLDQATKKQIKFPKTDEEIEAWSSKYPDVARIVDTIARKRANEAVELGEKKFESLKTMEKQISKERAESELHRMHPDFTSIRSDSKFHEWVALQPINIQDSLYKNSTDALSASRAIDLYKSDMKISKRGRPSNDAAKAVTKTTSSAPATSDKAKYSESMVDKMSEREYEKHEEDIMEAMRSGRFDYDVSGAAR